MPSNVMKVAYPRQEHAAIMYIGLGVLYIALLSVLFLKGKPLFLYFLYFTLPLFWIANGIYMRVYPFAHITDGQILLDRGMFKKRLKIPVADILEVRKNELNKAIYEIHFDLNTGETMVYHPYNEKLLLETYTMIKDYLALDSGYG